MDENKDVENVLNEALELVNHCNYARASNLVKGVISQENSLKKLNSFQLQELAGVLLLSGEYDLACSTFRMSGNLAGEAFIKVILGQVDEAKKIIQEVPDSPAKNWCKFLIEVFSKNLFIKTWPTFLQIRHFMEITVYYLLATKNIVFLELLLSKLNKLLNINVDTEKFVGYAFFHFGKNKEAADILMKSLKRNQYDGEIYYVLGLIYDEEGLYNESLSMLENANLLLPDHYPTRFLKQKVLGKIQSRKN